MQEVFVQLSEFDGSFRLASEIRFRFYEHPVIELLTPPDGFNSEPTQIRISGANFINFADIMVRTLDATVDPPTIKPKLQTVWRDEQVLYLSPTELLVSMPSAQDARRGFSRRMVFEVSLNGGVDWATFGAGGTADSLPAYAAVEKPSVYAMSNQFAVLAGGFKQQLAIGDLRYDPACPTPAEDCPDNWNAISHCKFGERKTVLTHLDETRGECRVPSQLEGMTVVVELCTNGLLCFGGTLAESPIESHFLYTHEVQMLGLEPSEGHFSG
jgi:hypothetical protein